MKRIIILFLLLTITFSKGQELNLPVFTQYLADNPFVVSPAYAGIGDDLRIRVNGLTQWVGVRDAPQNQSVYADMRVLDQSGVGISFYNDSNGYTYQAGAKLSFAHHIILDYYSKQYLSFGISYNLNNFRIDHLKLKPVNFDPAINNDRGVSNNNFDVSLLYRNKGFYFSTNVSNVLKKDLDKFINQEPDLLLNYQAYTGYVFSNNEYKKTEFEPSMYFQYFASDGRSTTDLNIKYRKYNRDEDYYWVGASYRFLNDQPGRPINLGPMAGIKNSGFYFAYSYLTTFNSILPYHAGTHVITLGFDFLQNISNCPCTQKYVKE